MLASWQEGRRHASRGMSRPVVVQLQNSPAAGSPQVLHPPLAAAMGWLCSFDAAAPLALSSGSLRGVRLQRAVRARGPVLLGAVPGHRMGRPDLAFGRGRRGVHGGRGRPSGPVRRATAAGRTQAHTQTEIEAEGPQLPLLRVWCGDPLLGGRRQPRRRVPVLGAPCDATQRERSLRWRAWPSSRTGRTICGSWS